MDRVMQIVKRMNKGGIFSKGWHLYLRVVFSCDIMPGTKIGEGTTFAHTGLGTVIHPDVVIGRNCHIGQNVTIGGRGGLAVPYVGDNVQIGANALILGDVKVGNGSTVGAGAVVVHDVPEGRVAIGNPAKLI